MMGKTLCLPSLWVQAWKFPKPTRLPHCHQDQWVRLSLPAWEVDPWE